MTKPDHRGSELAPRPAQPRQLLDRILDDPQLVDSVHALEPRALARLIGHVGLEDAGELVSLATTEQLTGMLDEDLWTSPRPGADETFDPRRFALWLEVMIEAGEAFAARRLSEIDEDLVTLALHRLVLVIDIDRLAAEMADRGEEDEAVLLEKALESRPYEELGPYRVIARRHDGWDAIVSLLLALDRDHRDFLERLLDRLVHVSAESIEESGGLHSILTAEETLEADAAAEREDRRAREGFIAPSAAASFLALARATELADPAGSAAPDPITRAYFRDYRPEAHAAPARTEPRDAARLRSLLAEAGLLEVAARPRLAGATAEDGGRPADEGGSWFRDALAALAERDPDRHEQLLGELHYLANVLIAGCALERRRFRPFEAAAASVATCNLGLERLLQAGARDRAAGAGEDDRAPTPSSERSARGAPSGARVLLETSGAVALFRAGWRVLHDEVAAPARLARERVTTPLAPAARTALAALLGECPRLAGPLAARRDGGFSSTGTVPSFIATLAEVRAAQQFLAGL